MVKLGKILLLWWTAAFVLLFILAVGAVSLSLVIPGLAISAGLILACKSILTEEEFIKYSGYNIWCKILGISASLEDE